MLWFADSAIDLQPTHTGIISNHSDSLFTYSIGQSFDGFSDPGFTPAFDPVFSDPVLETQAQEVCGDDQFCLYDVATTGRLDIGQSTAMAGQAVEEMIVLPKPCKMVTVCVFLHVYACMQVWVFICHCIASKYLEANYWL